jgi:hypothetical protein
MWNSILPMLAQQPKFKAVVENIFNQPVEHVANCVGLFMKNIKEGPGIKNTAKERQRLFDRYYNGGMALGFKDWQSYIAAAKLAGYSDMDVCLSFRKERGWADTTVEKIQQLSEDIIPQFIEKGKVSGLIPPEMFPDCGIPKTEIKTCGGDPPWDKQEYRNGANGIAETTNNAPKI